MRNILIDNRMVVQVNRLVRDMHFARSEAIKQRTQVILCKSRGNARCSAKSHWEEGWIVFADLNHDEALDRNERIMRSQGPLEGQTRLRYAGFRSHRFITFYSNGFTNVNGTFTFCDPRGSETARALILSKTGRLRISRTRADGHTPLTCDDDD